MSLEQHLKDGGGKSRKYLLAIGTSVVMVGCWALTGRFPALAPTFGELLGGLLASQAVFSGFNVATKYAVLNRFGKADLPPEEGPKEPTKPPAKPGANVPKPARPQKLVEQEEEGA